MSERYQSDTRQHYSSRLPQNQKFHVSNAYPNQLPMLAYVTGPINDFNRIAMKYNVYVPQMGLTYYDVMLVNDLSASANGVGNRPAPLRIGQQVLVQFFNNSTRPIITHSFWMSGNLAEALNQDTLPYKDNLTDVLSNYFGSINPTFLESGGDLSIDITPLIIRSQGPNNPEGSPGGAEVSGNLEASTAGGLKFSHTVGPYINSNTNYIEVNKGVRMSTAVKPFYEGLKEVRRTIYDINQGIDRVYSFVDKQIIPGVTARRLLPGFVGRIDDIATIALNFLDKAAAIATLMVDIIDIVDGQLEWFETSLLPFINRMVQKWGRISVDLGVIKVGTSLSLTGDSSFWFNVSTGLPRTDAWLNLYGNALLGKWTRFNLGDILGIDIPSELMGPPPILTLLPNGANNPLSIEGSTIIGTETDYPLTSYDPSLLGGLGGLVDRTIDEVTLNEEPNIDNTPVYRPEIPYKYVKKSVSDKYSNYTQFPLAKALTNIGIPKAGLFTDTLVDYYNTKSFLYLIKLLCILATKSEKLLLIYIVGQLFPEQLSNFLKELELEFIETDLVLNSQKFKDYYGFKELPNPNLSWVTNLSIYISEYTIEPVVSLLEQGEYFKAIIKAIHVYTKDDLYNYPRRVVELNKHFNKAIGF